MNMFRNKGTLNKSQGKKKKIILKKIIRINRWQRHRNKQVKGITTSYKIGKLSFSKIEFDFKYF